MEAELTEAEALERAFEETTRRIRQGLGPEAGLIDVLRDGVVTEAFVRSPAGRTLIRDSFQRATGLLQRMTASVEELTPERAFRDVLALSLELGIMRRVAATIRMGLSAEVEVLDRETQLNETDM